MKFYRLEPRFSQMPGRTDQQHSAPTFHFIGLLNDNFRSFQERIVRGKTHPTRVSCMEKRYGETK